MLQDTSNMSHPKPPGGRRSTRATVDRRTGRVEKLLLDGYRRRDVVRLVGKEFGVSPRTIDSDIKRARKNLANLGTTTREKLRADAIKRLRGISRKAQQRGNYAAAVSAERTVAEILGLKAPKHLDITTEISAQPVTEPEMTLEEANEELERLPELLTSLIESGSLKPTGDLVRNVDELSKALAAAVEPSTEPSHRSAEYDPQLH